MNLATRKRLAAPFYWLGWKLVRLADKIDGKQPNKATRDAIADSYAGKVDRPQPRKHK